MKSECSGMFATVYQSTPCRIPEDMNLRQYRCEVDEVRRRFCEMLLTLRRLTSYIYGAPILDVSRSHTTTQHSR